MTSGFSPGFGQGRVFRMLAGAKGGRTPLYPFLLGFCARYTGRPISSIYSSAEISFAAQMETQKAFGFDWGPVYGYASYGTWEFGGMVDMPVAEGQQAPAHRVYPVRGEEDLETLVRPDVETAGSLPLAMRFSRLQEQAGVPITVVLGGVFTMAGNICPAETLCRWMLRKPEAARRVLALAAGHIIDVIGHWARVFGPERVIPQLWEPLASNAILSPVHFEQFVLPLYRQIARSALDLGVRHLFYHICGEQNANLALWAQIPCGDPGLVSFGPEIAIERALEVFGEKAILIGNLSPSSLLDGPDSRVMDLAMEALRKGRPAPRGFMLSSGCEVPPDTPHQNLRALRQAIEAFHGR